MHLKRVISINNGWSILTTHKEAEWKEVLNTLELILDSSLTEVVEKAEELTKQDTSKGIGFIPFFFYAVYNGFLKGKANWTNELLLLNNARIEAERTKYFTKNGLSASMIGADGLAGEDFLTTIYLTIPYYHYSGLLDVSVILAPTTDTINYLIELGATEDHLKGITTEEVCRTEINKFGLSNNQVPIVLAFFSHTVPEEILVDEVVPLKIGGHVIERTIEFAPEFYQASVGLLSYFGEVLRQKDPNTKAKVRIEQDGNRVRLHIESPSGDIEIIEKQLEQYALVVSRQAEPETLLANRAHIMQLETQLDVARIQVKQAQDLMQLAEGQYTQRINSLEKQVEFLQTQFAVQILQTGQVINLATKQNDSHERLQTILLAHSDTLFRDLLQEASGNQQLLEAVRSLHQNLLAGITTVEIEDQLERALSTIKEGKPGFLGRIISEFQGATYKAAANSTLTWVTTWIASHTG